jgi:hypothetical protein
VHLGPGKRRAARVLIVVKCLAACDPPGAPAEPDAGLAAPADAAPAPDADADAGTPPADADAPDATPACALTALAPASDFALPAGYGERAFPGVHRFTPACADGLAAPAYQWRALSRGAADLLVTDECAASDVGTTTWRRFPAGPSGFAPAVDVALPAGYGPGAFARGFGEAASCAADAPAFRLADLDGDGRQDLVVFADCDDPGVGVSHWRVAFAGDAGFAAPVAFALPAGYDAKAFTTTFRYDPACPAPALHLEDLTGDGALDLVIRRDCTDLTIGTSAWRVHPATPGGFGPAQAYALPAGYAPGLFRHTSGVPGCLAGDVPGFFTSDITGDGRTDLVVYAGCADATVGVDHWVVHSGGPTGFGAAQTLALPPGYPTGAFARGPLAATADCESGDPAEAIGWALGPVDRGPASILVTADCADASLGASRWRVHRQVAGGFDDGHDLPLPADLGDGGYHGTYRAVADCAAHRPGFMFLDVDGDGASDLVRFDDCDDPTVGTARWRVNRGVCAPAGG